jgi:hypothetical protein
LTAASDSITPVRLSPDEAALRAFSTFEAAISTPDFSTVSSQIRQVIERSLSPPDASNSLAKRLLECLSSSQNPISSNSARNFSSCLAVCRDVSANLSAFIFDWFQRQPDANRLKKDLILCLKNSNCVDLSELDTYFFENLVSPSSAIASFVRSMQAVSNSYFPQSNQVSVCSPQHSLSYALFRLCPKWKRLLCNRNHSNCKILLLTWANDTKPS